jgi:poly(3-hydroxybutyrate) depolymerase
MTKVRIGSIAAALALSACGGGGDHGVTGPVSQPPPGDGGGSLFVDQIDDKGCYVHYGDVPRPKTSTLDGQVFGLVNLCTTLGGEMLTDFTDSDGTPRFACLSTPANASAQTPLPLLVWVHPSLFPIDTIRLTDIPYQMSTADLSGDPARPGFILLLPAGRDTNHYYPSVDANGLGWDNWYRNLDRTSPYLNVDVATLDHFIDEAVARGNVDPDRIYMSGWSNGSAMTILYALNTPRIAAAAVYSAPNPFGEFDDPCPQAPFGDNPLPIYHVHNDCDIFGICPGGEKLFSDLIASGVDTNLKDQLVNAALQAAGACNALCDPGQPLGESLGSQEHTRWPLGWTGSMLDFLRDHPKGAPAK